MELQELKIYKERLENDYEQLLTYRGRLLEQIKLEEQNLSLGGISSVNQGLNKDKKISELEKKIKELQNELAERNIKDMSIREIAVFKERAVKSCEEIAFYRNKISKQAELEEKKFEEVKKNKNDILRRIDESISEENRKLASVKQEKDYFVKNLDKREGELNLKRKEINSEEKTAREELERCRELRQKQERELMELNEEKNKLVETNKAKKDIETAAAVYTQKIKEINEKLVFLSISEKGIKQETARIKTASLELEREKRKIELGKEAVEKMRETFVQREKEIGKNLQHLENQQLQLRSALAEIKKREDKLNG